MTSNGVSGRGAYLICNNGDQFDNQLVQYFEKHPNLKWVKTNAAFGNNVPVGSVPINSAGGLHYVGRITITISNGTFTQIGKYWPPHNSFYYSDALNVNGFVQHTGEFEILACQP